MFVNKQEGKMDKLKVFGIGLVTLIAANVGGGVLFNNEYTAILIDINRLLVDLGMPLNFETLFNTSVGN